jgi:outer membrane protein TolC
MSALAHPFLAIVASAAVATSPAEPTGGAELSLVDFLRAAVQANPLLSAARHDVEAADAERESMGGRLFPTLSALLLAGLPLAAMRWLGARRSRKRCASPATGCR